MNKKENKKLPLYRQLMVLLLSIVIIAGYSLPAAVFADDSESASNQAPQASSSQIESEMDDSSGAKNTGSANEDGTTAQAGSESSAADSHADIVNSGDAANGDAEEEAGVLENEADTNDADEPEGALDVVYLSSNGSDDNDGTTTSTPVKTLAKALELVKNGGTITLVNTTTVSENVTSGKTVTIKGSGNGIVIASGAKLSIANLTMTGFGNAITVNSGGELGDGKYTLDGNTNAFYLNGGNIQGTSRSALTISANNSAINWTVGSELNNCTVNQSKSTESDINNGLIMHNSSLSTKGIFYYLVKDVLIDNSEWTVDADGIGAGTGITLTENTSGKFDVINGSSITVKNVYKVRSLWGITLKYNSDSKGITTTYTTNIENSTLNFINTGAAGLNVNSGNTVINNSVITGSDQYSTGALFGAQSAGTISVINNSVVNTEASANWETGAGDGSNYTVTGGSHRVKYEPSYTGGVDFGSTVPTNGSAYGNESLMLFKLASSGTNSFEVLAKNGETYTYNVANASSDGNKYVWAPAVTIIYDLNNADAKFSDGTSENKTTQIIRGNSPSLVSTYEGTGKTVITTPEVDASGTEKVFLGWYYEENGTEKAFTNDTAVTKNTTVYAKWANGNRAVYHNGDVTYSTESKTAKVLSYETVLDSESKFENKGKKFVCWTTSADVEKDASGNITNKVDVDSAIDYTDIEPGEDGYKEYHLYAQYEDEEYTIKFSANGGTFSDDSVFKTKSDIFEIQTDNEGGEVAVVKSKAKYEDLIDDILNAAGYTGSTSDADDELYLGTTGNSAIYNIATRDNYTPAKGLDIAAWYTDPSAEAYAADGKITSDTIYYLHWTLEDNIEKVEAYNIALDSDMWGESKSSGGNFDLESTLKVSPQITNVGLDEEFPVTGAIATQQIKDQMDLLEERFFPGSTGDETSKISLKNTKSTFTAVLTIPEDVEIPEGVENNISLSGAGTYNGKDVFKIKSTKLDKSARTITINLELNTAEIAFNTYDELKAAIASTDEYIRVTVDGFTLSSGVSNNEELTFVGDISGNFESLASMKIDENDNESIKLFAFSWKGAQTEIGRDLKATNDDITYTVRATRPVAQNILSDIRIGENTENTAVYSVYPGDTVDLTGTIDAKQIKTQMEGIEYLYPNVHDLESIKLSDLESTFTVTLKVPDDMTLPETVTPVLENFGNEGDETFEIADTKVDGNTVTVTLTLKDGITNYKQLKDAVFACGDGTLDDAYNWMKLTIPGVKVNEDAPAENMTVEGEVTGDFAAVASVNEGNERIFKFSWTAIQWDEGRDFIKSSGDDEITFTLKPTETEVKSIKGDLLINDDDTEHESIPVIAIGESFDYKATLRVDTIKAQMDEVENRMKELFADRWTDEKRNSIALSDTDCKFTATLEVPEGIKFPASADAYTLSGTNAFTITNVDVPYDVANGNGGVVTVTFTLEDFTTYKDLYNAIHGDDSEEGSASTYKTENVLTVDVEGAEFADSAKSGELYTVNGNISGYLRSVASSGSVRQCFSFIWLSEQDKNIPADIDGTDSGLDGTDKILPEDSTEIKLTIKATDKISVKGTVTWDDENNKDKTRPESVTISLYANGEKVNEVVVIANDTNTYEFTGLPEYDETGKIVYTTSQNDVPLYKTTQDGYDFLNVYRSTKTDNNDGGSKNSNDTSSKSPKTGDNSNLIIWGAILCVAIVIVIVIIYRRRRNR